MTCKTLTREEWAEKTAPFTWMSIEKSVVDTGTMRAWIEEHCGDGWIWFDRHDQWAASIAFGADSDYFLFKVWLLGQ